MWIVPHQFICYVYVTVLIRIFSQTHTRTDGDPYQKQITECVALVSHEVSRQLASDKLRPRAISAQTAKLLAQQLDSAQTCSAEQGTFCVHVFFCFLWGVGGWEGGRPPRGGGGGAGGGGGGGGLSTRSEPSNPSSVAAFGRATFSHKGRRKEEPLLRIRTPTYP